MTTTTETPRANRYAGPCGRCGAKVAAGAGIYEHGCCWHANEAACNKTTKTWRRYESHAAYEQGQRFLNEVWAAEGIARPELLSATVSSPLSLRTRHQGVEFSWDCGTRNMRASNGRSTKVEMPEELPLDLVLTFNEWGRRSYHWLRAAAVAQAEAAAIRSLLG
jgi:hypothetical protein